MALNLRPQLEVRDLELVLALAESGSTAAAAQALHLTQSAISRALGQAEDRLGTRLFERGARGVVPTTAGARLIAAAPRLLTDLNEVERSLLVPVAPLRLVRLVCECYTAYRWLPSAAAQLSQRMPDLQLSIQTEHTRDPVSALVSGQIDVALLTTGRLPKGDVSLAEQPLFSDELVFVISTQHPLARKKSLTPADLEQHSLITAYTPPAEVSWFVRSVFGRRKPRLSLLRLPLTEAIVDAARAGMGVAVLSEWMASGYLDDGSLVVRRLEKGPLRRAWRIAYRRDALDTAQRLLVALSKSAPRLTRP
jgi:LysR family transcriptional regulator, regulator for metE and metH